MVGINRQPPELEGGAPTRLYGNVSGTPGAGYRPSLSTSYFARTLRAGARYCGAPALSMPIGAAQAADSQGPASESRCF